MTYPKPCLSKLSQLSNSETVQRSCKCIATSNKCLATSNKCIATSSKKLLVAKCSELSTERLSWPWRVELQGASVSQVLTTNEEFLVGIKLILQGNIQATHLDRFTSGLPRKRSSESSDTIPSETIPKEASSY